jgi:hypothetical protein
MISIYGGDCTWITGIADELFARGGAKCSCAIRTGTDGAEVVVTEDAGGMTVSERDLYGIIADFGGGFGAGFGLKHRQCRGGSWPGGGES